MTDEKPADLTDWLRRPWNPQSGRPAAHPNARFTTPAKQCPVIAKEWEDPKGVPDRCHPLRRTPRECRSACYRIFRLATRNISRRNDKQRNDCGRRRQSRQLRRDPMAMLPFCGYNMGDYFAHWLKVGKTPGAKMPKIYLRELVPQRRTRQVPVARLWRKQPRFEMDLRTLQRHRQRRRYADRTSAAA